MPVPACCSQISIISAISDSQLFEWNILSTIQISKIFEWDVGTGPLYWYQVSTVQANACPNIDYLGSGYIEVHNIMATDISHLCEQLVDKKFNKKIQSVTRWSKPALKCDIEAEMKAGVDNCCPSFIAVDFCVPECLVNLDSSTCVLNDVDYAVTWYTEYTLMSQALVSIGETLTLGQQIGIIGDTPTDHPKLHFGLGDGVGGGNVGQTSDIYSWFNYPLVGTRDGGQVAPGASSLTSDDLDFIRTQTNAPIDPNESDCEWTISFAPLSHSGLEYYSMDFSCLNTGNTLNLPVYNACGGCGVTNTVIDVQNNGVNGWAVVVEHVKPASAAIPMSIGAVIPQRMEPVVWKGYSASSFEIRKPTPKLIDLGGFFMGELFKIGHNLNRSRLINSIFARNKFNIPVDFDLYYNENSDSWQYNKHFDGKNDSFSILCELAKSKDSDSWDFYINFSHCRNKRKLNTRFKVRFFNAPLKEFEVNINFSFHSSTVAINEPWILETNTILDELGLLTNGKWEVECMMLKLVGEIK